MYAAYGDSSECFFQLGCHDRKMAGPLIEHNRSILKTPVAKLNRAADKMSRPFLKKLMGQHPSFAKHTEAYAAGLECDPYHLAQAALMPELASAINTWIPNLFSGPLGCSSYFMWDDKREALVHGRILDFPLMGSFDRHERALLTQFHHGPKIFSLGSAGLPYPSLTCQTERGISFALHQKFTNIFDPRGTPIFELVLQMLQSCDDLKEVLQFLKKNRTLTCWGFYMGFSSGEVLAADVAGTEVFHRTYRMGPNASAKAKDKDSAGEILYFCNQLENPSWGSSDFIYPLGLDYHNHMHRSVAHKKIARYFANSKQRQGHTMEKLMRMMGTPWMPADLSPEKWEADNLTPSSVQIATLCPDKQKVLFMPESAPKHFRGQWIDIGHTFENPRQQRRSLPQKRKPQTIPKKRAKNPGDLWRGQKSFMAAQMALQTKTGPDRHHLAYHHLQMAETYMQGHPEAHMAHFFLLVLRYLDKTHHRELPQLLSEFEHLKSRLPTHLEGQRLLFVARLERQLEGHTRVRAEHIENPHLQRLFILEKKIPHQLLAVVAKRLIIPRFDLIDIICPLRL